MSYELEGNIKHIGETAAFGAKGFIKRELIVTTADKYPQDIKFEFVKEKTSLLDSFKAGQQVRVGFDIRGGEYNGKYYVNLTGWKIDASDGSGSRDNAPREQRSNQAPREQRGGGGGGGNNNDRDRNQGGPRPPKQPPTVEDDFNQDGEEYPF